MAYESTISPLLAVASLGAVFGALILMLVAERPEWIALREFIYVHAQKLMAIVAGTAMAASLYYSEAVGFLPCELCWYQRIAMYPLAVLLVVAVVTRGRVAPRYLVVLAGVGLAISIYHFEHQLFPGTGGTCSGPVSCSGKYVEEFGLITIPFMAGCGFLTILLLQIAEWRVSYLFKREGHLEMSEIAGAQSAAGVS